jgi:hypothetical protein
MHLLLAVVVGWTLFPLAPGSYWTLRDVESGTKNAISIRKGRVLHGFPGAGDLRVRRAGHTVQAWDAKERRWEDFFRFGAKVGTRHEVKLPTTLWQAVEVRVATKTATVRDYHRKAHAGCTRFTFRQLRPLADAGLVDMAFCPRAGLVRYSETTIAGPRTFALAR